MSSYSNYLRAKKCCINIWPLKNNVAVPWSNTQITVQGNNGKYVAA
jgi:hypothetical protein